MIDGESAEFYLHDGPVIGILEKAPQGDGSYRYEPFRSMGHYAMLTQIQSGTKVGCSVQFKERIIRFFVTDIPEYGVIQVVMSE